MTRRDNDAFVVVHDFMMHELGLNGITLLVYARIYGFCSNGKADFYDLCQDFGHFCLRFYAAKGSTSQAFKVLSKNASITSAGTR